MADLFSALTSATRALEAQRFALDVTGQNIANVNTPGYSRRVVDFAAVPPEIPQSAGRGVEVAGIRAQRDRLVERRLYQETTGAGREAAIADALGLVEVALGAGGQGIDSRLTAYFNSLSRLADSPTSAVARQDVLLQGTALATAFRDTAARFGELRRDADRRVGATVDEINQISARIAVLNGALGDAGHTGPGLHMQDELANLVRQLAALTDITVVGRPDGGVDIDIADGRALVVGHTAYTVSAAATAPEGLTAVTLGGADITARLTGGRLGGLLQVRDAYIPGYVGQIDEAAFALAQAVNAVHAAGFDLDGGTGQAFFGFANPPAGTAGAAAALIVNPAVAGDIRRIAAARAAEPGDNGAARDMAAIRDARLLGGGTATLVDSWGQLVYRVGRDVQTANDESALRRQIVLQVERLRDEVSGVSLDEEAMNLMKFQRAYEANARFFQVIDQALATLINIVGR